MWLRFVLPALLSLLAAPALAAQRTFVSVNGSDTNSCAVTSPCRGFAAAIALTDPGGEVIVLDSGGYGVVTIGQSVSIVAPTGVYGGISVFAPDDGVVVNGSNIDVVLRGLVINGQGGVDGVNFQDGHSLLITNCVVSGMSDDGLSSAAAGYLHVEDSEFSRNKKHGIAISAALDAVVDRVRVEANGGAGLVAVEDASVSVSNSVVADNGGDGLSVTSDSATATLAVTDSVITGHLKGFGISVGNAQSSGTALLTVEHTTVTNNRYGIWANNNGGTSVAHASVANSTITANTTVGLAVALGSVVLASNNTISKNGIGVENVATFQSPQNNIVAGNTTNHSGSVTVITPY